MDAAKRRSPGLVYFVPAVAYTFCLALPAEFTQPGDHLLDEPCSEWMRQKEERLKENSGRLPGCESGFGPQCLPALSKKHFLQGTGEHIYGVGSKKDRIIF